MRKISMEYISTIVSGLDPDSFSSIISYLVLMEGLTATDIMTWSRDDCNNFLFDRSVDYARSKGALLEAPIPNNVVPIKKD
jgi:hypothetical protein